MKKILSSVALLFLLGTGAYSQTQFAVGLKGGLNFANLDVSSAGSAYNSRTGYHGGAFFLIKLGKIGIQPELVFSKQGSTVKIVNTDFESNYDYFNIPVILKLYTIAGINIQAGPQFGFVTSATGPLTSGGSGYTIQDIKDKLKSSDICVALGLGWDAPFGLMVDARYNLGLTNINNSGSTEVKNQVIQVSLGYKLFKFGK
jgi:Outer membrane protein beta-barrel domain